MSKVYVCPICGYTYDPDKEVIPFEELPSSWVCPWCKAPKALFEERSLEPEPEKQHTVQSVKEEIRPLNYLEAAVLCSNLARGCEKQYLFEEADHFNALAAHFEKLEPVPTEGTVTLMKECLQEDLTHYQPALRQEAQAAKDRGVLRALTWQEKVTMILESLLVRYETEGETMLEGVPIYVCSICGFIYVGDDVPEICPVCKVPGWKLTKIEGGDFR